MLDRLREIVLWVGAAAGVLAVLAGIAVAFFGFNVLVFRSGSMAPDIPTGGLAVSRTVPAADIEVGDVVSVVAANGDRITHRVVSTTVRGGEASLVLRGDANATPDSELYVVTSADRVVASVPVGGYVVAHALTPPGLVAVACLALMLLVLGTGRDADDEDDDEDDPAGEDGAAGEDPAAEPGRHAGEAHRPWVARGAGIVAAVAAGALAVSGVHGTRAQFTDPARATTSASAAKWFTCDAAARGIGSPYLYWRFDETGALPVVAADSSVNNRPGAYVTVLGIGATNGVARACVRDTGAAVTLNNGPYIASSVNLAATPGPNTFAVSIWFRTSTTTGGKLVGFGSSRTGASGSYDRHVYMTNNGRIVFGVYPNAVRTISSGAGLNDNRWHQAVASLSPAGMKLYVDGALVASDGAVTTAQAYSGWWRAGYDSLASWTDAPTNQAFTGTLDDFVVYTTAPTDADVAAGYRAAF